MPVLPDRSALPGRYLEALLLLAAAVLFFTGLGSHSIHNADEARYWIVIDEMMEAGRLDDFTLRGEAYFNKAPLRIDMSHALARGFGLTPWTLRLPSAVMGLVCIGLVLALGRRLYSVRAARWAALILLTSTQFLYTHGVRSGEMDSTLIAFWLAALLVATRVREQPAALWWCALWVGLAGLVKHLAYVGPVGATVVLWWLIHGDLRRIGWRRLLLAGVLVLGVVAPWHILQVVRHGQAFIDGYLGREVVERVAGDYEAGYGWAFYLTVVKDGLFAWSLLLPFVVVAAVRRLPQDRSSLFLLLLSTAMVGGLMVTQGDLSWYVMPALPVLALLIGHWLADASSGRGRLLAWVLTAVVLALSPTNVLTWDVHRHFAIEGLISADLLGVVQGAPLWPPQVAVAGLMGIGLLAWWGGRLRIGRQTVLVAFAGFSLACAALPLHTAFERSDIDRLALELADQEGVDRGVVCVAPEENSVVYAHLERAAGEVVTVVRLADRDPQRWCVLHRRDLGDSPVQLPFLERGDWIALPPEQP